MLRVAALRRVNATAEIRRVTISRTATHSNAQRSNAQCKCERPLANSIRLVLHLLYRVYLKWVKGKGSPYSIAVRRVPELISVLDSLQVA